MGQRGFRLYEELLLRPGCLIEPGNRDPPAVRLRCEIPESGLCRVLPRSQGTGQPAMHRQLARQRRAHLGQEFGLLAGAGDSHPLERPVELDIDIEGPAIFMEMEERPGSAREGTALALPQLRELTQVR